MKKIFSYAMMLLAGTFALTSCEKDLDSNPTLIQPTEFTLNAPEAGLEVVDLAKSKGVRLTWSQPKYTEEHAPVVATYTVEISNTGKFEKAYDEEAEDNSAADHIALEESFTTCNALLDAADIDKSLMKLNQWEESEVPSNHEIYFRVKSAVKDAVMAEHGVIYSNIQNLFVSPYYIELSDAPVVMWYLVGNHFGGKWGSVIGETALPMFIIPGYDYDKKSGTGDITYENYFITGQFDNTNGNESSTAGFKIQRSDFNWDWGLTGDNGKFNTIIYRNGGGDGGHIVAEENGYYKITVNTKTLTAKMEKLDITPAVFDGVCLSGSFNEWADTDMLPYNSDGIENHVWYLTVDFDADQEVKFKQAGSWDSNWGSSEFPVGTGVGNGANIAVPAGKWLIIFNDITGEYNFIQL